ncbi:MAG: transketolase [Nitriliruptorales bacterium]|nr:transketolase [Nitriliruptorales bacterium]
MAPSTGEAGTRPSLDSSGETDAPRGTDLEQLAINTIRTLAMDAVQAANSGHPGMPMACAPMAYVLFTEALDHDPARPDWWNRDRFVLSAGHGSMLLYAALHLSGYERPTLDDIRNFRQWGSPTAGHPENFELAGVETTTGPLGQGFGNGVGMAIAGARLAEEFNRPGHDIIDNRVYAIVSDGDIMEGVASEAASLAGHLRLGNIVYLYDDNHITIDGATDLSFSEDVLARFDAYGWHTDRVNDGNDLDAIRAAIAAAEADDRPSLISVRTVIGYGSPNFAGTSKTHGAPLGEEEVALSKQHLGWPFEEPFTVPDEVRDAFDQRQRGAALTAAWDARWEAYGQAHPDLAAELERRMDGRLPTDWADVIPDLTDDAATRKSSGQVINALAPVLPELMGGSADLAGSNNTDVADGGDFSAKDRGGRNLRFGVREHAMGAVANGMSLYGGFIPYAATFLIFTDYARPAIRLSALMGRKVIWVMTHDSVGLGEDGPTHQPIEHLASLRAIPNLQVIRPADGEEVGQAWQAALTHDGPSVLALTRQGVPHIGDKPADAVARGGYVIHEEADPDVVLIGTGSEVHLALEAVDLLEEHAISARVVSLPCWERFSEQDEDYRASVLGEGVPRVAVEAASTFGWERWVGDSGAIVGLDRFGASAPYERIYTELGLTAQGIADTALHLLRR